MVAPLRYAPNNNFAAPSPWPTGFNLADVGTSAQLNSLPSGVKGLVFIDGKQGLTASVKSQIDDCATAPSKIWGWYIADEPYPDLVPAANLKAVSDYCKSKVNAPVFIVLGNGTSTGPEWEGNVNYAPSAQAGYITNAGIDLFGVDSYPCRVDGFNASYIDDHVNNLLANGWPLSSLIPVTQCFGGENPWQMPTVAQIQEMYAHWDALIPSPAFEYVYTWGCGYSQGQTNSLQIADQSYRDFYAARYAPPPVQPSWYAGNVAPAASLGANGDYYVQSTLLQKQNGSWVAAPNAK